MLILKKCATLVHPWLLLVPPRHLTIHRKLSVMCTLRYFKNWLSWISSLKQNKIGFAFVDYVTDFWQIWNLNSMLCLKINPRQFNEIWLHGHTLNKISCNFWSHNENFHTVINRIKILRSRSVFEYKSQIVYCTISLIIIDILYKCCFIFWELCKKYSFSFDQT